MADAGDLGRRLARVEERLGTLSVVPQQLERLQDVPLQLSSMLGAINALSKRLEEAVANGTAALGTLHARVEPPVIRASSSPELGGRGCLARGFAGQLPRAGNPDADQSPRRQHPRAGSFDVDQGQWRQSPRDPRVGSKTKQFLRAQERTATNISGSSIASATPASPLIGTPADGVMIVQPAELTADSSCDEIASPPGTSGRQRRRKRAHSSPQRAGCDRAQKPGAHSRTAHVQRLPSSSSVSGGGGSPPSLHSQQSLSSLNSKRTYGAPAAVDDSQASGLEGIVPGSMVDFEPMSRVVTDLSSGESIGKGGHNGSDRAPSHEWMGVANSAAVALSLSLASSWQDSQEGLAGMASVLHGEYEEGTPCCILLPSSSWRIAWDTLTVVAALVSGAVIPVALAYLGLDALSGERPVGVFLRLADALWIADIALNFRTADYGSGKRRLIVDPHSIAVSYARSWLVPDVLAAWPLVLTPMVMAWVVYALKLLRVVRIWPIVTRQLKSRHSMMSLFRVGGAILFASHVLSCAWRLAQWSDDWAYKAAENEEALDLYIKDLYWVLMTMTTVGYGDVHPNGNGSRLYAILAMTVAPIFFGAVVSMLTHMMKGFFNDRIDTQIVEAKRFMRWRRVPTELQRRVEDNLRHNLLQERLTTMDPALFRLLSPAVQRDLSTGLLSGTVLQFPLFKGVPYSFVSELAQAHSWVQCLPGDLVVEEGQLIQEVVFVVHGQLRVHTPDCMEALTGEAEIGAGAWFGEACLFDKNRVRTATVIAMALSELAVLLAADFFRVLQKYPRLVESHKALDRDFRKGRLKIEQLAYRTYSQDGRVEGTTMWAHRRSRTRAMGSVEPVDEGRPVV